MATGFWLNWFADTDVVTTINGDGKMAFFAGECTFSSLAGNVTYSWRTAQNIKRGQEMVFDYGPEYWRDVAS